MTDMTEPQLETQTSDDLATAALDEVAESDEVATALTSLQNVIERNARELQRVGNELKEKRESLNNVFENDQELATAQQVAQEMTAQVKERRAKIQADPQTTSLKVQIGELSQQKKEIEETLSNHLVNYYQLTHSTSFDTSDGDQWEFRIQARVKSRKQPE